MYEIKSLVISAETMNEVKTFVFSAVLVLFLILLAAAYRSETKDQKHKKNKHIEETSEKKEEDLED